MASPQPDFFVRLSKELYDVAVRACMPATHLQVFLVVARMTYGDRGKKQAPVSTGALQKATGRSRSIIKVAVADLLARNVLTEVAPPGWSRSRVLSIQKDYEAWRTWQDPHRVSAEDVPAFLRHDWQDDEGQQSEQGHESEQGQQSGLDRASRATPGGPAERPEQGQQSDPTKDKTTLRPEKKKHSQRPADAGSPPLPLEETGDRFQDFWAAYPSHRRVDKAKAEKAWRARLKGGDSAKDMISAAGHYAVATRGVEARYVKLAATFIGSNRPFTEWVNGPPPGASSPATGGGTMTAAQIWDEAQALAERGE